MSDLQSIREAAPALLRATLIEEDWTKIAHAYNRPNRAYHNLYHLVEMATWFVRLDWQRPNEVYAALLFHDACYHALAPNNEARSARMAKRTLEDRFRPGTLDLDKVASLITLTAGHGSLPIADFDTDTAQFLDIDMAILGAARERYREYADGVAHEYRLVPRFQYKRGRRRFLQRLLEAPRIVLSGPVHEALEKRARENVAREFADAGVPAREMTK